MQSWPSQVCKIFPDITVCAEEGLENETKDAKISPLLGLTTLASFPLSQC